jgi:hypothetical protein
LKDESELMVSLERKILMLAELIRQVDHENRPEVSIQIPPQEIVLEMIGDLATWMANAFQIGWTRARRNPKLLSPRMEEKSDPFLSNKSESIEEIDYQFSLRTGHKAPISLGHRLSSKQPQRRKSPPQGSSEEFEQIVAGPRSSRPRRMHISPNEPMKQWFYEFAHWCFVHAKGGEFHVPVFPKDHDKKSTNAQKNYHRRIRRKRKGS